MKLKDCLVYQFYTRNITQPMSTHTHDKLRKHVVDITYCVFLVTNVKHVQNTSTYILAL
jgi:hypothetical protein